MSDLSFYRMRAIAVLAMTAAVPAIGACGDHKLGPSTPASVSIVSGDTQKILVGDRASQPLLVEIKNSDGSPLASIPVVWGHQRRRIAAAGCRYDGRERTSEGHLSLARHHGRSRHGEGRDQRYLPVQHDHVHGDRAANEVTSPYGVSSFFRRAIAARACAAAPLVG